MFRENVYSNYISEPIVTGNYQHEELKKLSNQSKNKIEFLLHGRMQGNLGVPLVSDDVIYNKVFMDVFESFQRSTKEDSPLITRIFSQYFLDNFGFDTKSIELSKKISNESFWQNYGLNIPDKIEKIEEINNETFYSILESMIWPHVKSPRPPSVTDRWLARPSGSGRSLLSTLYTTYYTSQRLVVYNV